jgi:hypothetical protein
MKTAQSLVRDDASGGDGTGSAIRCVFPKPEMRTVLLVQVDNATPIVTNREKSVTLGILGTVVLWWSMKLSPGMGELCSGAASMGTRELGFWRSRNGCLIRWPAAVCAWRQCPQLAAMRCWI